MDDDEGRAEVTIYLLDEEIEGLSSDEIDEVVVASIEKLRPELATWAVASMRHVLGPDGTRHEYVVELVRANAEEA